MEKRLLGGSGLEVSKLSFGLMTFGSGGGDFSAIGDTHAGDAARQVAIAIDAGVTLFDTSDNYSSGESEMVLGAALGARRKDVLIATKVFGRTGPGDEDVGLSREHIVAACDASLRRLGTDWIDLYQVHNFDGLVPLEETLRALDDLVRAGKVRHVGCSNHFGWQLTKALTLSERLGVARYVSQQIQYSLMIRDAETELLPAGIDQGVGALIYSPLAQGYLTGKFTSGAAAGARLTDRGHLRHFESERGAAIIAVLNRLTATRGATTPGQIAIAWLLKRPGVTSVIFGARTEAQLKNNLGAASLRLDDAEMAELDRVSARPSGYPQSAQNVFHPERNPSLFPRTKK